MSRPDVVGVRPVAIALPAGLFLGGLVHSDRRFRTRSVLLALGTIIFMVLASMAATRLFPWGGDGGVQYRVMRLAFILMVPPVVYIESVKCCLFFDDKETVDTYENILKDLAAVALDEEESRAVINSILEGLQ